MNFICLNGKILPSSQAVHQADNRSYRYGDGLFETMKVMGGNILLGPYHFDRLFKGMQVLGYQVPKLLGPEKLENEILGLCEKNDCKQLSRVRLSVSRGHGGISEPENDLQYLIECWLLNDTVNQLNENGLIIGVFPDARKNMDAFSNLKSANFLPYVMAAQYAKNRQWNDGLVLNAAGNIADTSIANIFIIKGDTIQTPGLDQGCIAGVMRRYLLEKLRAGNYKIVEGAIIPASLEEADEIFLTNTIHGIRWVKQCGDKLYGNQYSKEIYKRYIQTIFS